MRVLLISKQHMYSSYRGLLRELSQLGVDLTVAVPDRWGRDRLENSDTRGFDLRVLPSVLAGKNHFYFYTRFLEDEGFDLVHLDEEPWSFVTHLWLRRIKKWRKPLVFVTWQNIMKYYPPPFSFFERETFEYADRAIAGSREIESVLRQRGFTKPVEFVPLGAHPDIFFPREVSALRSELQLEGKFVIGYAGRMIAAKGISDLMQAFAQLPKDCVLLMVGDGPARAETEELARRTGVDTRVRWIPQVPTATVPEYMSLFDVSVLPSRTTANWKEQFGRVLVESMACGTPIVGSSSAEIPITTGDAGLIYPEGNVTELAARLRTLYDDPVLLQRLSAAGRERFLQNFTHRKIAERVVGIYSRVLQRENAPAGASFG